MYVNRHGARASSDINHPGRHIASQIIAEGLDRGFVWKCSDNSRKETRVTNPSCAGENVSIVRYGTWKRMDTYERVWS